MDRSNDGDEPFAVDVSDRGDELLVAAELPGLRTQDIDVSVWTDRLRIVAEYDEGAEGTYLRRERDRGEGEVRRVIDLPEPVDETRVSASYTDGVLWVTLKKRDRPASIEIE
jgi:HSP20 family protein